MPKKQSPHTVSRQSVVDERRRTIASLRLRGMTQREIETNLPTLKIVNPRTGQRWSLGTINKDLQAIHQEWVKEATLAIGEHKANLLAELRELKRAAWEARDFQAILRAIDKECKILGVEAPTKVEHAGGPVVHFFLPEKEGDGRDGDE